MAEVRFPEVGSQVTGDSFQKPTVKCNYCGQKAEKLVINHSGVRATCLRHVETAKDDELATVRDIDPRKKKMLTDSKVHFESSPHPRPRGLEGIETPAIEATYDPYVELLEEGRPSRPQKCKYGDHPATKSLIWAEGAAYVPVCDEHEAHGRDVIERKNRDEVLDTVTIREAAETRVEDDITRVAREVAPLALPDYGHTAWDPKTRVVWWNAADYTGNEDIEKARKAFLAIDGVDDVDVDDEGWYPDGWERIPHRMSEGLFNEYLHPRGRGGEWVDKLNRSFSRDVPVNVGGDVALAAKLLGEGKRVELNQPHEVSTLLDKISEMVAESVAKGEAAPHFDLCRVSVKGTNLFCAGSKNVPRLQMPQFNRVPTPGSRADGMPKDAKGRVNLGWQFIEHLRDMGVEVDTDVTARADHLRASQSELNGAIVARITHEFEHGERKKLPIFVTKDDYVVDGHHNWAATIGEALRAHPTADVEMPVHRIDMPITDVLEEARRFTADWGLAPLGAISEGVFDEALHPRDRLGKWRTVAGKLAHIAYAADGALGSYHIEQGQKVWRVSKDGRPFGVARSLGSAKEMAAEHDSGAWSRDRHDLLERALVASPATAHMHEVWGGDPARMPEEDYQAARARLVALHDGLPDGSVREQTVKMALGESIRSAARERAQNSGPSDLFRGEKASRGGKGRKGLKVSAEGWADKVRDLARVPVLKQDELLAKRREAMNRTGQSASEANATAFLDEWWGKPGVARGRFQSVSGDPGTAFEEQHARIMEAGALIDAAVKQEIASEEKAHQAAVRASRAAEKARRGRWKEIDRLTAEVAAEGLVRDHDWMPEHTSPEEAQRRYTLYRREAVKRDGDEVVLSANRDVALAFMKADNDPRVVELRLRSQEAASASTDLALEERRSRNALVAARRRASYGALEEIRDLAFAGDLRVSGWNQQLESASAAVDRLHEATAWLPADWVKSSNDHRSKLVAGLAQRGKYIHSHSLDLKTNERTSVLLGSDSPAVDGVGSGVGVMVHELVHRAEETHDGIKGAEWTFYTARVSPGQNRRWEDPKPLAALVGVDSYAPEERARPDDFIEPYAGKTYGDAPDSAYELLSVGIEDLVTGHSGVMNDDEYRQFVYGSMALL